MLRKRIKPKYEIILLALAGREMYGQQIVQAIAAASHGTRRLRNGSLYPTLAEMEESGIISSDGVKGEGQRKYSLTEEGRKAMEETQRFRAVLLSGGTAVVLHDENPQKVE